MAEGYDPTATSIVPASQAAPNHVGSTTKPRGRAPPLPPSPLRPPSSTSTSPHRKSSTASKHTTREKSSIFPFTSRKRVARRHGSGQLPGGALNIVVPNVSEWAVVVPPDENGQHQNARRYIMNQPLVLVKAQCDINRKHNMRPERKV